MELVSKAAFDTVMAANITREDYSGAITLQTERPRPFTQMVEQVGATAQLHKWPEQARNAPFTGATSYPEGILPPTNSKASLKLSNVTCRQGLTASVTDSEAAQ